MNFNEEILLPVDIRVESISRQTLVERIRSLETKNIDLTSKLEKSESEAFNLTHENKKLKAQVDLLLDKLITNKSGYDTKVVASQELHELIDSKLGAL
jgi:cell division protein FtsB